ncbi:MAG: SDR family oxidoreductase [Planctomycetales bacterium]|nr:SDR family oxidoreductase [Planctomycetales bacterium]
MQISLENKVAWITGGSEGIGRGIALLAAQCGAKVAVTGRDLEPLESVARAIADQGAEALVAVADVGDSQQVQQAVAKIIARWGHLDFVCANAGTNGKWAPIDELSPEDWSNTIQVNLTGTYLTIHHSVPHLKETGASIVIMSSVNGTRMFSNEGASAYAASKAGQLALGQMLALELAPRKIRVNVICPGAIESNIHEKTERENLNSIETPVEFPTGKIPLTGGKMGTPEQVAQLAVFLASDAASHITGTPVWIDGAQSLLQG